MAIKILHISQSAGGVETHILYLLKYLNKNKYHNTLICWTNGTLANNAKNLGVDVKLVELVREISPIKDLRALLTIYQIIKKNHFNIVHTHSSKAGFIGRLAAKIAGNKSIIYTPNAFYYIRTEGMKRILFMLFERIAISFTDCLLATSRSEASRAIHDLKYPGNKVVIINNSIYIHAKRIKKQLSIKTKTILFIGRLDYQKNPEMFVRVSRIIHEKQPDVRFVMLGFGAWDSLGTNIKILIDEYNLTDIYEMINWLPRNEVLDVISSCYLFVSTSRYDGLPYVPLEAMSLKKPVIATNVDGLKDVVVHNETGYLVEVDDDYNMSRFILMLLKNNNLLDQMGQASYQRIKNFFDIEKNINKTEAIYDELKVGKLDLF